MQGCRAPKPMQGEPGPEEASEGQEARAARGSLNSPSGLPCPQNPKTEQQVSKASMPRVTGAVQVLSPRRRGGRAPDREECDQDSSPECQGRTMAPDPTLGLPIDPKNESEVGACACELNVLIANQI